MDDPSRLSQPTHLPQPLPELPMLPDMYEKDTRKFQLAQLKARHNRIIDLHITGFSDTDIAEELCVTTMTIANCLKGELAKDKIAERRGMIDVDTADRVEKVNQIVASSLDLVEEVIKGKGAGLGASITLRARTAVDMIKKQVPDQAVIREVKTSAYLIEHRMSTIIQRAKDLEEDGQIIEVSAEEISDGTEGTDGGEPPKASEGPLT